jgi:hypothetical protein
MSNPVVLFVRVMATVARLLGPGSIRSVVAESVLVKQQLLILNRPRQRSLNLCFSDRLVAGLCAFFIRPARLIHCGNRAEALDAFEHQPGSEGPQISPAVLMQAQG